MSVLRIYDPSECDAASAPLDWERCRTCEGTKRINRSVQGVSVPEQVCLTCDGHGSLKAAALAELSDLGTPTEGSQTWRLDGRLVGAWTSRQFERREAAGEYPDPHTLSREKLLERVEASIRWHYEDRVAFRVRCEDCWHPMSDGTWLGDTDPPRELGVVPPWFWRNVASEPDSFDWVSVHYSPCDSECDHGGPARARVGERPWEYRPDAPPDLIRRQASERSIQVEASWRPVDVRTLGWPHDLRPEKLAVLCLRCFAGHGT